MYFLDLNIFICLIGFTNFQEDRHCSITEAKETIFILENLCSPLLFMRLQSKVDGMCGQEQLLICIFNISSTFLDEYLSLNNLK